MGVIKNSLNTTVIHQVSSNATYVIPGNNTVSNVSYTNTDGAYQTVASASIRKIASNGTWTIKRGANTVWTASGNFLQDFAGHNMPITVDKTGDLTLETTGTGSILIELSKESK